MSASRKNQSSRGQTPPPEKDDIPSDNTISGRDFGRLESDVSTLKTEVETLKTKVGKLNDQKNWLLGAGAALGVVLAILWDLIKSGGSQ